MPANFPKIKFSNVCCFPYFLPDADDTNQLAALCQVLALADCQPSLGILMPGSPIVAGQVVGRPAKKATDSLESL